MDNGVHNAQVGAGACAVTHETSNVIVHHVNMTHRGVNLGETCGEAMR